MRFKTWLETISLKGSYKGGYFQRLVAASYQLSPRSDPEAMPAFEELADKMSRQHQFLQSKFKFAPQSDFDTFSTKRLKSIINQQRAQGVARPELPVLSTPPEGGHPAFSNDQNVMMRGVHDIMGHVYGNNPISARGEYAAYNTHLKTLCNIEQLRAGKCLAAKALFTEIIGQTSYYYVYGNYTVQKAVFLPDFDVWRVGSLAPESNLNGFFVLQNKDLVPRPDFDWNRFAEERPDLAAELRRQEKLKAAKAPLAQLGQPA